MKTDDINNLRICDILIEVLESVNDEGMWMPLDSRGIVLAPKYRPILAQIVDIVGIKVVSSVIEVCDEGYILLKTNLDLFLNIVKSYLDYKSRLVVLPVDFEKAFKSLKSLAILVDRTDIIVKTNVGGVKLSKAFCLLLNETIRTAGLEDKMSALYSCDSKIKTWVNDDVLIDKLIVLEDVIRAKVDNWQKFGFDIIDELEDLTMNEDKYMSLANFMNQELKNCRD